MVKKSALQQKQKNFSVTCNLNTKANQVAQVLRQAQIMIEDMKLNDITFVLTNKLDWSFGMAKKKGRQNRSCMDNFYFNIVADPEGLIKVYQLFKKKLTA